MRMHTTNLALKSSLLAAIVMAALTALPAAAESKPAPALPGCHDPRAIARFLGLTADQAAQVKTLRAAYQATVAPLKSQIEPLHTEIQDLLDAANPDACQIGTVRIEIHTLYEGVEAARTTFETGFEALLTPAQLVKWNALQAVCHAQDETTGA